MSALRCKVQWRAAFVVRATRVCAEAQQQLGHTNNAMPGCPMKRRLTANVLLEVEAGGAPKEAATSLEATATNGVVQGVHPVVPEARRSADQPAAHRSRSVDLRGHV
eukprot:CAMPEP_0170317472 /NCGR_PEP_ID=MMETSP0116_2-20130129/59407_1 /TAXON_ID=400756 /ORGANISM="Durinskia baltica, Strain CSIRO CS-38" /LENGTH=106 /DNA_ID=CAMNT_0010570117 /DNA_START=1 /DNA_END=318 /DNA_ORIENTATION=+